MTTLRDRLLPVVARARQIPATLGVRVWTVTVRVETWDRSLGPDAILRSNVDTVLSPVPHVRALGPGDSSWLGGGVMGDSTGELRGGEYDVGPITPAYSGGGYSATDLLPVPTSPSQRVVWLLTGPDLQADGEPFVVARLTTTAFGHSVHLRRTVDLR